MGGGCPQGPFVPGITAPTIPPLPLQVATMGGASLRAQVSTHGHLGCLGEWHCVKKQGRPQHAGRGSP